MRGSSSASPSTGSIAPRNRLASLSLRALPDLLCCQCLWMQLLLPHGTGPHHEQAAPCPQHTHAAHCGTQPMLLTDVSVWPATQGLVLTLVS